MLGLSSRVYCCSSVLEQLRFHLIAGSHYSDLRRASAAVTLGRALSVFNLSVYPSMEIASCQVADSAEMEAVLSPPPNVTVALAHLST